MVSVKEVAFNRQIGALMTEMEHSILKPDRETVTAVQLFLKMHPYYYGRNARHMVRLQPLFIHDPSVPQEISFIYEYSSFKKQSQHILWVTFMYSVVNLYYHCAVDVNSRFKTSFSLGVETYY